MIVIVDRKKSGSVGEVEGGRGRSLIHQALMLKVSTYDCRTGDQSAYAESPTEKYILHVQTVTQGNTASHIMATATVRTPRRSASRHCRASCRINKTGGNLFGMSGA